jgi:hypothetical protein
MIAVAHAHVSRSRTPYHERLATAIPVEIMNAR